MSATAWKRSGGMSGAVQNTLPIRLVAAQPLEQVERHLLGALGTFQLIVIVGSAFCS